MITTDVVLKNARIISYNTKYNTVEVDVEGIRFVVPTDQTYLSAEELYTLKYNEDK